MKYTRLFIFLFFISVQTLQSQTINPFYQQITEGVNYDSIYNRLQTYENFGNKGISSQALKNTAEWLINFYNGLGFTDIHVDTIEFNGNQLYNIIVTKTGTDYPDKYFIIDGHYDAANCPGTDDNGSGTVIIMEVARLLKDIDTRYSIKFIHFTGEEAGFIGSHYYVNNTVVTQNLDILLLLNIDMVGGTAGMSNNIIICERDEAGLSQNNSLSYAYTDTLANLTSLYSTMQTEISNAYGSDYMPFEQNGEIITGYYEYNENPYNHSAGDILIHMDPISVKELSKAATGATLYFSLAYNSSDIKNVNKQNSHIKVFPNPAKEILYIDSDEDTYLTISNLLGEKIIDCVLIGKGNQILSLDKLKPGSYFYTFLNDKNGIESKGKIIIE